MIATRGSKHRFSDTVVFLQHRKPQCYQRLFCLVNYPCTLEYLAQIGLLCGDFPALSLSSHWPFIPSTGHMVSVKALYRDRLEAQTPASDSLQWKLARY